LSREKALGVSFFTPFVGFLHNENIGSCDAMDFNNDALNELKATVANPCNLVDAYNKVVHDINLPDKDANADVGTFDLHYDQQLSKEKALGVSFFTPFVGFPQDKNIGSFDAMDFNNDALNELKATIANPGNLVDPYNKVVHDINLPDDDANADVGTFDLHFGGDSHSEKVSELRLLTNTQVPDKTEGNESNPRLQSVVYLLFSYIVFD
jgi:hypothetical protein